MKNGWIIPAILFLFACSASVYPQQRRAVEYGGATRVYLNDELIRFDIPPMISNGRLLVPLRFIFQPLGARVAYRANPRTVTVTGIEKSVLLRVGNRIAQVNGENRLMDVAPTISRGRVLVPLRFVAQTLGASIAYFPNERLVRIKSLPQ